jgi:hypothetical protein
VLADVSVTAAKNKKKTKKQWVLGKAYAFSISSKSNRQNAASNLWKVYGIKSNHRQDLWTEKARV